MSSLDFLKSRAYTAKYEVGRIVDDGAVPIRIKHVGTGTSTPTVVLSSTSSLLTITDGAGTATAIDLSTAAYNTVGEVADYINGLANWSCKVLDALRADATDNMWIDGAVTASVVDGETVFDIKTDTSAFKSLTYRCTYNRGVKNEKPSGLHRVKLQGITYNANVNAASANGVRVYEWDNRFKTETQIWQATSVDATDTAITFASGQGLITANEGNDLIVRVIDGTSLTDDAANFLQVSFTKE